MFSCSHSPLRTRHALSALILVLIALLAYRPALDAEFIWDDLPIFASPVLTQGPEALAEIWTNPSAVGSEEHFWPVVYTVLWIQSHLWGGVDSAFGFHLVNVALHAANSLLAWLLLRRIGLGSRESWVGAALFALHPVHVESVAWVIELKDVLSGFFYLLAALAFFRFREATRSRVLWYGAVLLFFALGMLSKSIVVTLPVALLLVVWWRSGKLERSDLASVAPVLILGLALVLVDVGIANTAQSATFELPWLERVQIAGRAFWFYLLKLLWPAGLMAIYPRWPVGADRPAMYLPAVALVVLFGVLWGSRDRIGRGPFAAFAFYLVTLAPILGLIRFSYMQHSYVADRYQYLASLGPLALAGGIWGLADRRWNAGPSRTAWRAGTAAVLLALGVLTWKQASLWRSDRTLFEANVARNPEAWLAWQMLGRSYAGSGEWDRAIGSFQEAMRIRPDDPVNRRNLAVVLLRTGKPGEAIAHLDEVLSRNPEDQRAAALRRQALSAAAERTSSTVLRQTGGGAVR